MVAATVRTIFAQPDPHSTRTQLRLVADMLRDRHPAVSDLLMEAEADVTAYAAFPHPHRKKLSSTNPLERLMREIKRRADVVGVFPDDASILRLVGAVLAEQHDVGVGMAVPPGGASSTMCPPAPVWLAI